ncbi:MAG: hypothetical protein WC956_08760 [bacterium]
MVKGMKVSMGQQFITDSKGKRRAVVIDVESYEKMLEDLDDLRVIAERRENPKVDALRFVTRLKKHGTV